MSSRRSDGQTSQSHAASVIPRKSQCMSDFRNFSVNFFFVSPWVAYIISVISSVIIS